MTNLKKFTICFLCLMITCMVLSFWHFGGDSTKRKFFGERVVHHPIIPSQQSLTTPNTSTELSRSNCFLLILILSTANAKGMQRRTAVRKTWAVDAAELQVPVIIKFVIGTDELGDKLKQTITAEDNEFHDMLFLPEVVDAYKHLASKVLRSFVWSVQNVDYSYLMKTDDDSFVTIKMLVDELLARTNKKPLYWGKIYQRANVHHDDQNAEENWFLCDHYIPFAAGAGYVLSQEIVQAIVNNADRLTLYNNEDTSVGTWVAGFDMERKDDNRFNVAKVKCEKHQLLTHYVDASHMLVIHKRLKQTGSVCAV